MRVTRRSHLSKIASDDDWFAEPWWEDGAGQRGADRGQQHHLYGPQIAPGTPQHQEDVRDDDSPFIDPRSTKRGNKAGSGKRRKGRL